MLSETTDNTLRTRAMNRLLEDLLEVKDQNKEIATFSIIIVDEFSAKILNNYLTMTDILNRGIFSVESIYKNRQHFPNYQGIYFISPTDKSCKALANDYKDRKDPTYKKIHIFFTHKASEQHLDLLVNETVINRTITCKEFNLSFFTVAPNVFDLRLESQLKIYKCRDYIQEKIVRVIAQRLLTVCCTLKIKPAVQYQKNSVLCTKLASILDDYIKESNFKEEKEGEQGLLLIVDRTLDLAGPILHDYNYEAMAYDFLDILDGKFMLNGKKYELKWDDELWRKYRSLHIAEVFDTLTKDLQDFKNSDLSKARDVTRLDSFEGMTSVLTSMNAYNKKTTELSTHIDISQELNRLYKERSIYDIIELEQDIITGDNQGRRINTRDIFKTFTILKSKIQDQREDLIRLLMLLFISLSIAEKDFKVLQGKLSEDEEKIFEVLRSQFGILESAKGKAEFRGKNKIEGKTGGNIGTKLNDSANFSSLRSVPPFQILIEKASRNSLDYNEFPLCNWGDKPLPKPEESKFSGKNLFKATTDDMDINEGKKDLIFFSVGGIGRNEIKALEKLEDDNILNHKLTIGATNVFNAKEYIRAIRNLSESKMEEVDRDCFEAYGIKDSILNITFNSNSTDSFNK